MAGEGETISIIDKASIDAQTRDAINAEVSTLIRFPNLESEIWNLKFAP